MNPRVPVIVKCGWVAAMILWGGPVAWSMELPSEPLANLKSEEFRKRESAQAELLAWARGNPEPAKDALLQMSKTGDDPEVRERCLAVLRELVLGDEYLREGEGYVGIMMRDEFATIPGDPKLRAVIRVNQVVADSAAQQAGLQLNDLIAAMGDQVWYDGMASLAFSAKIRQLKPTSKVTLKVLRAGKLIDIEVKLGRRPLIADNLFFDARPIDPETAERNARDAYFRQWLERRKSSK